MCHVFQRGEGSARTSASLLLSLPPPPSFRPVFFTHRSVRHSLMFYIYPPRQQVRKNKSAALPQVPSEGGGGGGGESANSLHSH